MRAVQLRRVLFTGLLISLMIGAHEVGYTQPQLFPWASDAAFAKGPSMKAARMRHWQEALPDGRVIAFGGHGKEFVSLKTADVWSPSTKKFSTLMMKYTHDSPAFAKLLDGRYLLAGGSSDRGVPAYATSEIFNPKTSTFTATGSMVRFRASGAAGTLTNGKVLIAGAWWIHNDAHTYGELYDPASGKFAATGPLKVKRSNAVVFPTKDGKALVAGGMGPQADPAYIDKVELYNPATNKFTIYRNTLINGETGWYVIQWSCPRALEDQKMSDGRYLFIAYRLVDGAWQIRLITFDPAKKLFALLTVTPPLPDPAQVWFSWVPILDNQKKKAYLLGTLPINGSTQTQVLYTLDLTTMTLTEDPAQYAVGYQTTYCGQSLLGDGRIIMTGGTKDGTNFNPVANTIYVVPD